MSVFIGSIPNSQRDDIELANDILQGNIAKKGWINILEKEFQNIYKNEPFLFNRGRDSLYFFLKLLNLRNDDEVILQAFTCVAVVSPIIWANAKPVYVDIRKDTFNMNIDLLKKKITSNTRAIIVQHTFGNIVDTSKVREIIEKENDGRSKERKISLIEDCAHLFTKDIQKYNIGNYSDMYFFSFSQDKSISCTQGALMIINNPMLLKKAKLQYQKIPFPSDRDADYNAKYIVLWDNIKRNYFKTLIPFTNITVGRILIIIYRLFGLTKKQADNNTVYDSDIVRMSNIQACLLFNQLKKAETFNNHREKIVTIYDNLLQDFFSFNSKSKNLLRYPILIQNNQEIKKKLLELNIISGKWYSTPVYPLDYDEKSLKSVGYNIGSCPNAEILGKQILNLPTNIEVTENIAKSIIEIVNNYAKPINI